MPINVATGSVDLEYSDVEISGLVALTWERTFSSNRLGVPNSRLGVGWTCQYFSTLRIDENGFELDAPAGTVRFDVDPRSILQGDARALNYASFAEIFRLDSRLVVQRWDIEAGSVWRYCFPVAHVGTTQSLSSIENASGQGLDLTWSARQLESVKQRVEGGVLHVAYGENDLVASLVFESPAGRHYTLATYEYDQALRLAAVRDAAGFADFYEYDGDGRIRREVVKDGGVFTFAYDQEGRCIRRVGVDGYDAKRVAYHTAAGFSQVTDSTGARTVYRYNGDGQITEEINALGATQQRAFDAYGRVVAKVNANGATTRFEYDDNGDRIKVINALGQEFGFRYNRHHLVTEIIAPTGLVWTRRYDASNRVVTSADPTESEWRIQYDRDGLPAVIVDPNGAARQQRFVAGRMVQRTDWLGNWYSYQVDDFGRLVTEVDPEGHVFTYRYDLAGNLTQMVWPDGTQISQESDIAGNVVRFTDQDGNSVHYNYGPCRRLLQHRDRSGNVVRYEWGTEPGRLVKVINERNEEYTLEWDDGGRLVKTTSFDGIELAYVYDAAGYLVTVTNGAGEQQHLERDALGRLVTRRLSTGGTHTYEYDALSNPIAGASTDHTVSFLRDPLGRIIREQQDNRWVASEYDRVGNLTRLSSSFGDDIGYRFDANRAVQSASLLGESWEFIRNSVGDEIGRQLPGRISVRQSFDLRGLLQTQSVQREAVTPVDIVRREFSHDARGLLRRIVDTTIGELRYDYDLSARLTGIISRDQEERWRHDPAGNAIDLLERDAAGPRTTERVYGPGNRLLRDGDTTFDYDGNGRLIRKTEPRSGLPPRVWQYRWDAVNQLTGITTPEGRVWRYTYDAFARRLGKIGPTRTITYVWNKYYLIKEFGSKGASTWTWIFEPDSFRPIAQLNNETLQSIITTQAGTPQDLVDTLGKVVRLSDPHRTITSADRRRGCLLGDQGQYYDAESGLYYNHFRYYDPDVGRFISQDPKNIRAGLNLYLYPPDPLRTADPLGLDSGALDRALGGTTGDGNQAHHIIPEQVMNQNGDMIAAAQKQGFERDGKSNGILLPSDDATATALNVPSHRGSHPQYNAQVGAEVAAIRAQWKSGQISDAEMAAQLKGVQDKWRDKIENNDPSLPRGKTSSCKLG